MRSYNQKKNNSNLDITQFEQNLQNLKKMISNKKILQKLYNTNTLANALKAYDSKFQKKILKLEQTIKYKFKNKILLLEALTHGSYHTKIKNYISNIPIHNYQRLEFLGDCLLNLIISICLIYTFPHLKEGDLSKLRSTLINETSLYLLAKRIKLGNYLLLGKGEELDKGRKKISILADAMEAIIASIYLDSDFNTCFKIVAQLFKDKKFLQSLQMKNNIDYKTLLQEWSQKNLKTTPTYKVIKESGPTHLKIFEIGVYLENESLIAKGTGHSKKEASQKAAQKAYKLLTEKS